MSNSIWHKPEEKPKGFSFIMEHHKAYDFDNHKVITAYDVFESGGNPQNPFDDNTIRWCYLDELIAQADKAERLQKAVDVAVHSFNEIRAGVPNDIWVFDEATKATNKIKQLIKD